MKHHDIKLSQHVGLLYIKEHQLITLVSPDMENKPDKP